MSREHGDQIIYAVNLTPSSFEVHMCGVWMWGMLCVCVCVLS